ncbi:hypothetical protein DFJ73DRAFT_820930 [Zopfochytrium polystomum]|nr:hypothetical protein DFJ73DRAFT_820930 [Zopfochytrium polystomum]
MAGVTVEEYFIEHWVPSSSLADYPTEFLDAVVPDDPYLRDFLAGNCETSTRTITSSGDVFYTFASFPLRSPGSQSAESIAETEPASPMVESSHFPTYFRDTGADDGASFSDEQNALENSQVVDDLPLPLRFEDDDLLVVNPNRATLIHRKPIFAFDDIANDFGTLNSLSRPRRRRHMSDATTILDSPIQDEQDDEDDDNDSEVHASAGHRAESVGAIHNSTPPLSPETDLAQPHPAQDGMVFPQGFPHRASPTGSGAQSDMHVRRDQDAYLSASVSSSAHFQQPTATPRYHRLSSLYRGTPSASSSSSASDRLGSFGSHSDDLTRVITRVVTLERKGRKSVVRVVSMIQAEPPASATTPRSFDFPDGATARSYPSLSRSVRHDAPAPSVTGVTEGSSQLRATRSRDLSQIDPNEGASEVVDPVQSGTPSEALGAGGGYDDREKSLSIFPPASSSSAAASASIGQKTP